MDTKNNEEVDTWCISVHMYNYRKREEEEEEEVGTRYMCMNIYGVVCDMLEQLLQNTTCTAC